MSYPAARYLGDEGEISAIFRPADQEPELTIGSGTALRYLATGASTNGQFGLYRVEMGADTPGPSAHFHRTISESFFILSGTVRLFNGKGWIDATAGDFLFVPEGCTPSTTNQTSRHRCCCSSHPAPGASRTSKPSPRSPPVVSSAPRSGRISAFHDSYFV